MGDPEPCRGGRALRPGVSAFRVVPVTGRTVRRPWSTACVDGLRPAPLDDVGLVPVVRRHSDALGPSVPVRVTAEALPPLPPDVETAAYRIAQEALTNVARHSGARSADVGLRAHHGRLEVAVVDDGAGFDPPLGGELRPDGVGLDSMRTRARAVGGELTVSSGPGGTRVVAGLPLEDRP